MDKIDFKKKYKEIYAPSAKKPSIITVPEFQYAVLSGEGNPGTSQLFSDCIGALYGFSYAISMSYKSDFNVPNFYNYVVPPLEGIWDIIDGKVFDINHKENLKWTIGIMQPEFVTEEVFNKAKAIAIEKKKNTLINDIQLLKVPLRSCCTMMHKGSFDDEKQTFDIMEAYIKEQGVKRATKVHREIYLNDFRKTPTEKLKTVLQFDVTQNDTIR